MSYIIFVTLPITALCILRIDHVSLLVSQVIAPRLVLFLAQGNRCISGPSPRNDQKKLAWTIFSLKHFND